MDYDFDDEIIIEDDINYNILGNDVLQNFPFIEDDVNALTDYELISRTYEYLDDKKANKEDIPNLDEYYNKDEVNDLLDEKVDNEELDSYYNKIEVNSLLDEKADISDIPDVSDFITKDVNDLTYYTKSSDLSEVATSGNYDDLINKPTIPDVSNFITKDVNDLTYYTLTSSLSSVATSGDYGDLLNKPTIPTVPTNVSSFNNDAGYITKSVNDLTNYTTSTALTTLLSNKEDVSVLGSNANGNYLKLANGVLIQWNRIIVDDQAITGSYGNLYQGTRTITFPIPFVGDLPTVQCSEFQYGSGATWGCVVGNGTTLTETLLRGWDCFSRSTGTNCRISWIAIGKWK